MLVPNTISLNEEIMQLYLETLVPAISEPGDDLNHVSTCMFDVQLLQVRMHVYDTWVIYKVGR